MRVFSRYVFSDLRPMAGVGYPAGVAIVDACAVGCVLESERKLERPEEHMPPRLRRELPSIKISAEERNQRATNTYVVYSSTCDMYSSSSCDGAAHVLSTLLRSYVRYVLRIVSTAAAVVSPFYGAITLWVIT